MTNQNPNILSLCLAVALSITTLMGCGVTAEAPPEPVFPVSGVIMCNGEPLAGADVAFTNQMKKRSGFGRTDAEGRYSLTTFGQGDGAVEGKSLVTVTKFVEVVEAGPQPETDSDDYQPPGIGVDDAAANVSQDVPTQYANVKTSGLFANVVSEGENKFDFELK